MDQKVYKIRELAEEIRVHPNTVRNYIKAGEFPNAYKSGLGRNSHWRIPAADVDAFLERRKIQTPPPPNT